MAGPYVLVVEDNPVNARLLCRRLEREGFQVQLAESGEKAIQLAQSQHPHLILMDIGLPTIDGWETTRRLKTIANTAAIPIIALTAHDSAEDRHRCLSAGCNDYDTKPVQLQRLLVKMEHLITSPPPNAASTAYEMAGKIND